MTRIDESRSGKQKPHRPLVKAALTKFDCPVRGNDRTPVRVHARAAFIILQLTNASLHTRTADAGFAQKMGVGEFCINDSIAPFTSPEGGPVRVSKAHALVLRVRQRQRQADHLLLRIAVFLGRKTAALRLGRVVSGYAARPLHIAQHTRAHHL